MKSPKAYYDNIRNCASTQPREVSVSWRVNNWGHKIPTAVCLHNFRPFLIHEYPEKWNLQRLITKTLETVQAHRRGSFPCPGELIIEGIKPHGGVPAQFPTFSDSWMAGKMKPPRVHYENIRNWASTPPWEFSVPWCINNWNIKLPRRCACTISNVFWFMNGRKNKIPKCLLRKHQKLCRHTAVWVFRVLVKY